ncbi:MAG: hypothetical protein AAFV53_30375 [Myxococcota bacterium]
MQPGISATPWKGHPIYRHSVDIGTGNHYAWGGIGYTFRPIPELGLSGAVGLAGVAGSVRYSPIPLLYIQAGYSPIPWNDALGIIYGIDGSFGLETTWGRFHGNIAGGLWTSANTGGLSLSEYSVTVGVGVNFGAPD